MLTQDGFIGVETTPDENIRVYHSRLRLMEDWQIQGGLAGATQLSDGTPVCATLEFLLSLPGVAEAQVMAYRFVVKKSPVFSWGEVEKPIAALLLGVRTVLDETSELDSLFHDIRRRAGRDSVVESKSEPKNDDSENDEFGRPVGVD